MLDKSIAASISVFQYWAKKLFGPLAAERGKQLGEDYRVKRENARRIAEQARDLVEGKVKPLFPRIS